MKDRRLPVVLQSEIAECGLVCMLMIAVYHGHRIDMRWLRSRFAASLAGMSLRRLSVIAQSLGLRHRIVHCPAAMLKSFGRPILLYWGRNHFVVFKTERDGKYIIHDPAIGRCTLSEEQFREKFSGYAMDLETPVDFVALTSERRARLYPALQRILWSLHGSLASLLVLSLCLELMGLIAPLLVQWVIDRVVPSERADWLVLLGALFSFALIARSMLALTRDWCVASISGIFVLRWGRDVFGHLIRLPLTFFEKRNIGDILSRYISIQAIQSILSSNIIASIIDGSTCLVALILLLGYWPSFALIAVVTVFCYAGVRLYVYDVLMTANREQVHASARQEGHMIEAVRGISTIKLFNDQEGRTARFSEHFTATLNRMIRVKFLSSLARSANDLIFGFSRVASIVLGGHLVMSGRMEIGQMIATLAYLEIFLVKSGGTVDNVIELRLLDVHFDRLTDITDELPEQLGETGIAPPSGELHFENVSFRYGKDEPWILRNFNATILPGESVVIVGPSGTGKTTLIKLLVGFLDAEEGCIRFNGINIRELGLATFRAMCGTVLQSDRLFHGSLLENICFFERSPDEQRVREAARLASIGEDIDGFPMGYQTLVGDMSSVLSAGQEQRVLLARAIYRNPGILILDEATSHLDVSNERLINQHISSLQMTRIIVAHRPETIQSADRIIRLESLDRASRTFSDSPGTL